jgi:hypothetical protein
MGTKKKRTAAAKSSSQPALTSLRTLFPTFTKSAYIARDAEARKGFIDELRENYLRRGLVLYVGSGVSRSVNLPIWHELIRSLTVTMMTRRVATAVDTLEGIPDAKREKAIAHMEAKVASSPGEEKPILMMARALKDHFGPALAGEIAKILYQPVLGPKRYQLLGGLANTRTQHREDAIRHIDSPLLRALVSLARSQRDVAGVQAIINYNFDDILEEKLRSEEVRCKTVLSGFDVVPPGTLASYHVHGVLPFEDYRRDPANVTTKGNFVFSEDEYHAEYSDAYRWSNMTQMSNLGRFTGLFVGLSMQDPNIRRLIDVTHRQYPEITNYAILTRKEPLANSTDDSATVLRNLFEDVEAQSFWKIGVRVIWADNFEEVPKLINAMCAL